MDGHDEGVGLDKHALTALISTIVGVGFLYVSLFHGPWSWGWIDGFAELFYNPDFGGMP